MKELFYIKGNSENPEEVKEALLEKYPNIEDLNDWSFTDEHAYYCVFDNMIDSTSINSGFGTFLRQYGTEIFPQKKQEFEDKILYQPIFRKIDKNLKIYYYESDYLSETIQEALNCDPDVYGYKEVKIKVLKK